MYEEYTLETTLRLAGICFSFLSEIELSKDRELDNFIIPKAKKADIIIRINRDWDNLILPESAPRLGEDLLCCYYREKDRLYCMTKGGSKGWIACSIYDASRQEIRCVINENPFLMPPDNLGSILRMIPMRAIFQKFQVLFFHASRILYKGSAILFTAPSGTGKTTQAGLWEQYRRAEILCNDRSLLRKTEKGWYSYGYPMDGSEPVRSNMKIPLGAVVLLRQGTVNYVERLRANQAAVLLMNQLVIDIWNPDAHKSAMENILRLLEDIPVYLLICTPDIRAVETLEVELEKDVVISYE